MVTRYLRNPTKVRRYLEFYQNSTKTNGKTIIVWLTSEGWGKWWMMTKPIISGTKTKPL